MTPEEIYALARSSILDSLASDVADELRQVMKNNIIVDVYNFSPAQYKRRYAGGGLIDDANIQTEVNGLSLTMKNTTPPASGEGYTTNKDLTDVIESGSGYDFTSKYGLYETPRPFVDHTYDDIVENNMVAVILAAQLKKDGFDVSTH